MNRVAGRAFSAMEPPLFVRQAGADGNTRGVDVPAPGPHVAGSDEPAPLPGLTGTLADARGIPRYGRRDEYERLRRAGADDLAWGRLYEGHVNAIQLIARLGTTAQRECAERDVTCGMLFGVWNTEAADGVRVAHAGDGGITLAGRKTFASGAGRVARAVISIAWQHETSQLAVVSMDRVRTTIDRSFWKPLGMETSDSFAVDFTGVHCDRDTLLGAPGDYERSPWFTAGAARFLAVQTGGIERLVSDFSAFLRRRDQHADPIQLTRFGKCVVAARTAGLWTRACLDAWMAYDEAPRPANESDLLLTVEGARGAVERCALDVLDRVERGVGARGLLESEPFARRIRDLRMYLRQPAIDATLLRVARASLTPQALA
jgi:alkylation response protein AidB-like acyl-CoA dehydrogenase